MNIDVFIKRAKEKAEKYKYRASFFESDNPVNAACIKAAKDHEQLAKWFEKFKEYQQLEEQGRLIKLPCKIGDKVWHISGRAIKEDVISGIEYSYDGMFYIWSNEDTWLGGFNDIVFLTKSEAEAKLKELRGEENESSNLHT